MELHNLLVTLELRSTGRRECRCQLPENIFVKKDLLSLGESITPRARNTVNSFSRITVALNQCCEYKYLNTYLNDIICNLYFVFYWFSKCLLYFNHCYLYF